MKLSRSQKTVHKPKHHLKHLYCNKFLEGFIKPLPRYGKAINAIVLVAFVMLVVAGAAAITVHNKPPSITTSQTSSTGGNNCLLSNSGCPDSKSSSTPTPTTQPAQTTTPSTTTKPKSTTPATSYPYVIDGIVYASPTCHYLGGYGEAYYRDKLVNELQGEVNYADQEYISLFGELRHNPPLDSADNNALVQQDLTDMNDNIIPIANNGIKSDYSQYVSDAQSIGCTTSIDTTNIPQIQPCTASYDVGEYMTFNCDILSTSIPSLE